METLEAALDAFSSEAMPLVWWVLDKDHDPRLWEEPSLEEPGLSIHGCGEDIKVTHYFTYCRNVIHSSGLMTWKVNKEVGLWQAN